LRSDFRAEQVTIAPDGAGLVHSLRRLFGVGLAYAIMFYVDYALAIAGGLLGAFVLVDAVMRKPDAFVAADRQTKTVWVAILAGAALFLILAALPSFITAMDLLWIAGCIAALVYLVDVRPRLRDIQRGTRW
jgi:hypothetical protein